VTSGGSLTGSSRARRPESVETPSQGGGLTFDSIGERGHGVGPGDAGRILRIASESVGRPIDPEEPTVCVRRLVGEPVEGVAVSLHVRVPGCRRRGGADGAGCRRGRSTARIADRGRRGLGRRGAASGGGEQDDQRSTPRMSEHVLPPASMRGRRSRVRCQASWRGGARGPATRRRAGSDPARSRRPRRQRQKTTDASRTARAAVTGGTCTGRDRSIPRENSPIEASGPVSDPSPVGRMPNPMNRSPATARPGSGDPADVARTAARSTRAATGINARAARRRWSIGRAYPLPVSRVAVRGRPPKGYVRTGRIGRLKAPASPPIPIGVRTLRIGRHRGRPVRPRR
jgi:hypothetical protein